MSSGKISNTQTNTHILHTKMRPYILYKVQHQKSNQK
jgi:hypothetical protein